MANLNRTNVELQDRFDEEREMGIDDGFVTKEIFLNKANRFKADDGSVVVDKFDFTLAEFYEKFAPYFLFDAIVRRTRHGSGFSS